MSYKYQNRHLQPRMCEELILELLSGKELERKEIIRFIPEVHLKRGGKPANANLTGVIKKALSNLKEKGLARNDHGYWIIKNTGITVPPEENKIPLEKKPVALTKNPKSNLGPVVELGEGQESVYLYYYPEYKTSATNDKKNKWHCKIGKSDSDPGQRIQGQGATSQPELPVFAVNYRTNQSALLEKAIHSILTYRNQKVDSGGNEWFMTNPEEFVGLIYFLNQGIK
ncbi:hypothetical protein A6P54_13180 [Bacillus sp. MKU004]|nr:hypothetical protein A6P54_13180 [Bacillus sp. MKU004]